MTTLDEILGAFEEALELERELGTRTVECDRALLMPLKPATPSTPQTLTPSTPQTLKLSNTQTFKPSNLQTLKPSNTQPLTPSNTQTFKPSNTQTSEPSNTQTFKPSNSQTSESSEIKDFAFIVDRRPEGEAAEMMRNMLRAMGCSNRDSMVKEAAEAATEKPHARVYIVLGREAFHVFAPDQRAALGMWTKVVDVPTVVTYSPAKILACFGSVGEGITKAKRQIWTDLKSALSLVGRAPVAAKR